MKITQSWTHQETGIGTYNIVGLGDDGLIYDWIVSGTRIRKGGGEWQPETPPYWKLRDGTK